MLIDTHTHLNFQAYSDDWRRVVDSAIQSDVQKMIIVGTDIDSSQKAIAMAERHPALYASIGIHPHHVKKYQQLTDQEFIQQSSHDLDQVLQLSKSNRVVAIGEIGLDQHQYQQTKYDTQQNSKDSDQLFHRQKHMFSEQTQLAQKLNLPLIIHSREVKDQVLTTLIQIFPNQMPAGVFHCYEGSKKYAKKILAANFYISFTGNITYSHDRQQVADTIPLDRLLLETDSPYMTPNPYRHQRNQPSNVKIIASHHAVSRGVSETEIIQATTRNAQTLFKLK